MADFQHVRPGDKKIKARTFNTMLDAARYFQTQQRNLGGSGELFQALFNPTVITVANISDAAVEPGDAMALVEPVILPADNESEFFHSLAMKVDIPNASYAGKFCILVDPIGAKYEDASSEERYHLGKAIVAGLAPARLNMVDEDHEWADVTNDSSSADPVLQSCGSGSARIIWSGDGASSEGLGVVLLNADRGGEWIKIGSASRDGSNFRWTYTVTRVRRTAANFAGWTEMASGAEFTAFNSLEQMNAASGLMGNGVDTANLSGTAMELQPAPPGAILLARWEFDAFVFEYVNSIDGECES